MPPGVSDTASTTTTATSAVLSDPATPVYLCELHGVVRDAEYHRCRLLLQGLSLFPDHQFLPTLRGTHEKEYSDHVCAIASELLPYDKKRRHLQRCDPFFVVNARDYLAGEEALLAFAMEATRRSRSELLIAASFGTADMSKHSTVDAEQELHVRSEAAAEEALRRYRQLTGHQYAYLLFEVDGVTLPRVELELFHRVCPKTCANFLALCEGTVHNRSADTDAMAPPLLGYKGNHVHRIVRGGWIQAGDLESHGDGPPRSLYGAEFPDESFTIAHDQVGVLSMANTGPHRNGSQFFLTLAALPWLDRRHVAFGRVVSGLWTLMTIGEIETQQEHPCVPCKIVDAGRIQD